jgi:crotonobetainyl-CoA:carnitine CoA-transferase CaiB-like acyl-CoA transferase
MLLGDLGADVIKVNGPMGAINRAAGGRLCRRRKHLLPSVNRNKRSLTCNFKSPQGLEALRAWPSARCVAH